MNTQAIKTITQIPGWALGADALHKVSRPSDAYDRIPVIRRSVDILADSVASVPFKLYRGEDQEAEWPFESDLPNLLREVVIAYLVEGAAYLLKLKNRVRTLGVQWLNPQTVTVHYEIRGEQVRKLFTQSGSASAIPASKVHTWGEEDILYFRQFSFRDDILPGRSRVSTVLDAANVLYHVTRFHGVFFEQGAMPTLIASTEGNPAPEELKRAETFFRRVMSGVQNAFRVLGLKGDWKFQNITPTLDTFEIEELSRYAIQQVAIGMGVPETMLSDAANYATASQHDQQFWKNTIVPLCRMLESVINPGLLAPMGLRLKFNEEELDVFQVDESKRAQSLNYLKSAGLPLTLAMQMLGYDLPGEMTYEELDEQLEEQREEMQQALLPAGPTNGQPNGQRPGEDQDRLDVTPDDEEERREMRTWERYAVRRMKEGKPEKALAFETAVISGVLVEAVKGALEAVQTADGARGVFRSVLSWEAYP